MSYFAENGKFLASCPLSLQTVYLCYSSGTTGNPQGVETTITISPRSLRWRLTPSLPTHGVDPQPDVLFASFPSYQMYGVVKLLLFPLSLGAPALVSTDFDQARFGQVVKRYRVTFVFVVPPMLAVLSRHDGMSCSRRKVVPVLIQHSTSTI